jgi:multidrug efflux pump subunit AcrA (membrane-fusion protein)
MRWKLFRRQLSISAPRMIVRSHLPWPLRWVVLALAFGFSAALALWAFEFGKEIAGLERGAKEELAQLKAEMKTMRDERERAQSIANTADSLLKAERTTQEKLNQQLRQAEAEVLALKADLGFFERLLPASGEGLAVRALQAETLQPGQLRYQLLVMQSGKSPAEFKGRYELQLAGTLEGKPWSFSPSTGPRALAVKQYARVEGLIDHPAPAVVKSVQVRVLDSSGGVRASQTVKL